MSESSHKQPTGRAVLFQRGDELSEFKALLDELAMPIEECRGGFPTPDKLEGARLVVVSGKRLLEFGAPNLTLWPRTIAVIDDSSKTLVAHLSRAGVAMVIRRPIHPRALRLLLLHEIYCGPERRGRKRVLVGHPIRVGLGLFKPKATLLELSPTGARLELANAPKVGSKLRILIGRDLTNSKPIKLHAKVVRSIHGSAKDKRPESEIGVTLLDAPRHAKSIKAILDRFALGPAPWGNAPRASEPINAQTIKTSPATSQSLRALPPSRANLAQDQPSQTESEAFEDTIDAQTTTTESEFATDAAESTGDETNQTLADSPSDNSSISNNSADNSAENAENAQDSSERRTETRITYDRRIVALGNEAARVLVGRDLSRGGMRIAGTPAVSIGDVLKVALHSGAQTEPTVVLARALRDDGDDGLVLSFEDLSEAQIDHLEKIISSGLPVHASSEDLGKPDDASDSIVIAEMLETSGPHSDFEIEAHLDSVFDTGPPVEDVR